MAGPAAPKDAVKKRKSFYIMRNKEIAGSPRPDGSGVQYIYLNDGRMVSSARIVGNIENTEMLELLKTAEGFRRLVHSIGVSAEGGDGKGTLGFVFQMYGKKDVYGSGTTLRHTVRMDGMEEEIVLEDCDWSGDDNVPGQVRFELKEAGMQVKVSVRFYLKDGYDAPEPEEEEAVDFSSPRYREMLEKSLVQTGNNRRLKRALEKAKAGEDVTIAFIGGSITQGAGAVPINTCCYAYKTFQGLCALSGKGTKENIHFIKAGVGGTPSELGMLRYERDVLRNGSVTPDIVVVEFAVNDAGDETGGECYDSLVRKILKGPGHPAVILLFAVFADDWNLQERLIPVGKAYELPMVSTRNAVVEQFYKKPQEGRAVSKNQFFYDCFHPTNTGHRIMADGLLYLLKTVEAQPEDAEEKETGEIVPPIGGHFENVKLLTDGQNTCGAVIDCGSFRHRDGELQAVELDESLEPAPEFPDNWMHREGDKPFAMDITCSSLLLIFKDSGSPDAGCAEVYADGEKVLTADPKVNGWTHCNARICFRGWEKKKHHIEVRMKPGEEQKQFTILGFGYVEEA